MNSSVDPGIMLRFKHFIVEVQNNLTLRLVLGNQYRKTAPEFYIRLGSTWGGWWVSKDFLEKSDDRILISAGLGGDISFETESAKNGIKVVGIDPDPKCHEFLDTFLPKGFFLKRYIAALSDESSTKTLYKFDENNFDSWTDESIAGERLISQHFRAIGINQLYSDLEIEEKYESVYLKMDIEGGEGVVIRSIISNRMKFGHLSVEFDFLNLISATAFNTRVKKITIARRLISDLEHINYRLVFHENFNFYWKYTE